MTCAYCGRVLEDPHPACLPCWDRGAPALDPRMTVLSSNIFELSRQKGLERQRRYYYRRKARS